jgi:2-polyprenyl-3-methyl-5-hydroxy-6-metoxy-1,4-benzoquinol methylase
MRTRWNEFPGGSGLNEAASMDGYYRDARHELLPYLPDQLGHVLELGCATGEHGALLLATGRAETVVGVDLYVPSDLARERLTRFERADVADWVATCTEQFDTILALDVLEHLEDPWTVLGRARYLLFPDGLVVASIPNIRFIKVVADLAARGRFDYRDAGVLDRTHLRFFTRRSIISMFEGAGFPAPTVRRLRHPMRPALERLLIRGLGDFGCKQFVVLAHPRARLAAAA